VGSTSGCAPPRTATSGCASPSARSSRACLTRSLIRHERHGLQLSRNPDFLARDAAILAEKWRVAVTAACGRWAYRRWRLRLVEWAERCRVERAVERGGGEAVAAVRSAGRLLRLLPESAPHVATALGRAMLGSRRFDWYRARARKALGRSDESVNDARVES
jgi:hypothetical protein